MKLFCVVLASFVTASGSMKPRPSSPVALSDAILTLPSRALAGMSETGRLNDLEDKSGDYDKGARGFHLHGDDWKGRWECHSMVSLRLFEDEQGRTLAARHLAAPLCAGSSPSDAYTSVFRVENGRWVDVASSVVPEATPRIWWFRFDDAGESIPCGFYIEYPHSNGRAHRHGDPKGELLWRDGHFQF